MHIIIKSLMVTFSHSNYRYLKTDFPPTAHNMLRLNIPSPEAHWREINHDLRETLATEFGESKCCRMVRFHFQHFHSRNSFSDFFPISFKCLMQLLLLYSTAQWEPMWQSVLEVEMTLSVSTAQASRNIQLYLICIKTNRYVVW